VQHADLPGEVALNPRPDVAGSGHQFRQAQALPSIRIVKRISHEFRAVPKILRPFLTHPPGTLISTRLALSKWEC
jgi:hypothetical protein